MPINPNLLLGGTQLQMPQQDPNAGMNALVRAMQIKDMQSNQQLTALKMQETQRGLERRNKMLGLLEQQYDKPEAREEALLRGGFVEEAAKLTKNRVDAAKVQADTDKNSVEAAHKRVNAWGQTMGFVRQNPTPENAVAAVQHLVTMGVIPAQQAQAALAQVQANPTPQNIAQFAEMGFRAALDAKEQLSKFQTNNIGGQTVTQGIDPVTGKASLVSSVQNTPTPGDLLTNSRGWAQINETKRHHGVSEGNAAQTLKLQQDKERREAGADLSSGGPVLGVPTPAVLPWANQTTPKDANKVKAQEIARGSKEIEKDVDAARKEAATAAAAARFIELNKKIPTGGLVDKVALTRWAQGMGSEYAEMEAITAKLAPAMREPGSGSTSDFDGKQFERATVGVDKPKKANENIARAVVARAQQAQEYADFRQTYLEQNGTLQGADRYWKEYVNANPIFDPSKPGAFELNGKRKGWTDHFKGKKSAPSAPAGGGDGLTAAEKAELEALRKQLGR